VTPIDVVRGPIQRTTSIALVAFATTACGVPPGGHLGITAGERDSRFGFTGHLSGAVVVSAPPTDGPGVLAWSVRGVSDAPGAGTPATHTVDLIFTPLDAAGDPVPMALPAVGAAGLDVTINNDDLAENVSVVVRDASGLALVAAQDGAAPLDDVVVAPGRALGSGYTLNCSLVTRSFALDVTRGSAHLSLDVDSDGTLPGTHGLHVHHFRTMQFVSDGWGSCTDASGAQSYFFIDRLPE
jgi:hypothetical protein